MAAASAAITTSRRGARRRGFKPLTYIAEGLRRLVAYAARFK
jgi:hypothetical protein